jgi:DNA-binding SARP family transcriptional activator/WD40 repeat protein
MRIALLGATEVDGADASVTRRDRVILGALVVSGDEALSSEQLADALWGDDPPKSAAKVIQGAVVRLRRLLGADSIETTGDGYRLLLDGDTIDTHAFENSVARARELAAVHEPERAARAYLQGLSLWRGAPLPELQDWDPGRAAAARLTEIRRSVEEELVEVRMESGRTVEAVADARNLVTREPFREHRWALLALALYRNGRQREALDALRRARSTLRDELGIDPGQELVALEAQILQQDPTLLDVPSAPAAVSAVCPYPGLRPFDADQSEFFVGREDDVRTCIVRLAEFPLLVVVGSSGSGKSSMVRAGVVPALREAGRSVVMLSPGTAPAASLTSVLSSGAKPEVVVVDQLEELFASAHASDIDPFLSRLTSLTEGGTLVAVTLRADYLSELSVHPGFARLAERGLVLLTPMTEDDLRRAIEEPARRSGLLLEPGLVDVLVRDVVGEAGGLPLMSHALAETWAHRDGNVLTVDGYTSTGGIRGAVAQSAERLYDALSAQDRTGLRGVLRRLVTPTAGEPVAARVPTRVFAATADAPRLLDLLVRARLVTTSADTATIAHESLVRAWPRLRTWLDEDVEGQRVLQHLQVAADGWDTAGRPDDELYRGARLTTAVEWRQRTAPVLSDSEVDFLTASSAHEQNEERRRVIELEHQKTRNRQLRWSLVGVAGLLVLALVAGSLAAVRGRQAQDSAAAARAAATQADAARLAAASRSVDQVDLALLMARQSAALSDDLARQADVLAAIVRADVVRSVTAEAQPDFNWVGDSSSPDGRRVLATDWKEFTDAGDDTVTVVDTSTGRPVGAAIPGDGAGFFDHGTAVAVMRDTHGAPGHDRVIVPVSANDERQLGPAEPVPGSVSRVGSGSNASQFSHSDMLHISPDGRVLLSLLDRQVRLWRWDGKSWHGPTEVALPRFPPSIPGQDALQHVTFSDDARFATMTVSYQGAPWYTATRMSIALDLRALHAMSPWTLGENASVSPDGRHWAVGTLGSGVGFEIRPTDPAVTTEVRVPAAAARASSFGWSPDGRRLAVGNFDGSISVYQVEPLALLGQFPAEGSDTDTIALADSGRTAISIHGDGRIMEHSVIGTDAVLRVTATTTEVGAVAAGPPRTVVAGGLDDGRIAVIDQDTGAVKRTLWLGPYSTPDRTAEPARHLLVTALAVTPDGTAIVAGNRSGHLRMWRVSDGVPLWTAQLGPVEQLAVSPDGRFLATFESVPDPTNPFATGPDSWFPARTTFRLWDLHTRRVLLAAPAAPAAGSAVKVRNLVFSSDSSMVAVPYMFDKVQVYQTRSPGKPVEIAPDELGAPGQGAVAVTFTPDSSTLLVQASDGSVIMPFDPHAGRRKGPSYPGPTGGGTIGFSPDGRWLFSRAGDGLSAFDVTSRRLLLDHLSVGSTYGGGYGEGSMAIVPDGYLYAGTETGVARIDIDPARWDAAACALAGRSLTRDEWSQLLPNRPYAPACAGQQDSTTQLGSTAK